MLDVKDDLDDIIKLSIKLKQQSKKGKRIEYLKRKNTWDDL